MVGLPKTPPESCLDEKTRQRLDQLTRWQQRTIWEYKRYKRIERRLERAEADCEQHEHEKKDEVPLSERIDKPKMRWALCLQILTRFLLCCPKKLQNFQRGQQRTPRNDCQRGGETSPLKRDHRQVEDTEERTQLGDWHSHIWEWSAEQRGPQDRERGENIILH